MTRQPVPATPHPTFSRRAKQPEAVLGQEPMHRPLPHQGPAQAQRVQQSPIRLLSALHTPNSPTPTHTNASTPDPNYSAVS